MNRLAEPPRRLLMGNEAIAWGAIEAGVRVVAAYPGTPSTEVTEKILEHAADYGIYAEWSVNEKVALETAIAASWAGARAMACMKQVGLNVASDPLMTLAYLGVKGGLVLIVADDPGPHSSQTEQDTRLFARFAKLPVLDPATPEEAREMVKAAFRLSEDLQVPVIVRPTTRTAHVCQDMSFSPPPLPALPLPPVRFERDPGWVILPSLSAKRHRRLNAIQDEMRRWFLQHRLNGIAPLCGEDGTAGCTGNCSEDTGNVKNAGYAGHSGKAVEDLAIVAGGVAYSYVQEGLAILGVSIPVYKVGAPVPLPSAPILDFLGNKKSVLIVEEQEPVIEEQLTVEAYRTGLCLSIIGKNSGHLPREGEFSTDLLLPLLRRFVTGSIHCDRTPAASASPAPLTPVGQPGSAPAISTGSAVAPAPVSAHSLPAPPLRTPILCAGCPHRNSFYAFIQAARSRDALFTGDIGCYTLGAMPPLGAADTIICMGASVAMAAGFSHIEPDRPHIAFLGDSTFFHSGIPPLINAVYQQARMTLVVLDNRTTAMTGHQPHPGLGRKGTGEIAPTIDIAAVARGCGVEWVRTVDPYDIAATIAAAREALDYPGVSVIIARRDCVNLARRSTPYRIDAEACRRCGICLHKFGCPALYEVKPADKASAALSEKNLSVEGAGAPTTDTGQGGKPAVAIAREKCFGCGACAQICPWKAISPEVAS
ncbi:2-oxoacid:ferredoxin oxidoreductase, alpha subunit, putative [Heliomicrobium modesticaldum Ice1]|uniref:Indolepyruvate oxidoreductase subunit IorA n=1 Tax=Heliobacterium modesticaldum (strain ATCC 51547 / Ice1) TaxID=498761 RepID=B0TFJ7_HELMI|nr:thiamine pyrophosphate-dependent enzyme [Heliomicrobium modesticaldum]ABZ83096.1 2-oxoacid:ferredoxin oxidoreductase, alpha subunit, putative [Heliomicrobium modesticaldum Ice1]